MTFYAVGHLGEFFFYISQEVSRRAVGFERRVILVLLVDEEAPGLGAVPMNLVHHAARLFSRFSGEFGKQPGSFIFASNLRYPCHGQNDHCLLRALGLALRSALAIAYSL